MNYYKRAIEVLKELGNINETKLIFEIARIDPKSVCKAYTRMHESKDASTIRFMNTCDGYTKMDIIRYYSDKRGVDIGSSREFINKTLKS